MTRSKNSTIELLLRPGITMHRAIIAALTAVLAMPAAAVADGAEGSRPAFAGPYVGAAVGYAMTEADLALSGQPATSLDIDGAEAGLFAGYAVRNGPFLGAVEAEGNYRTGSDDGLTAGGVMEIEARASVGASVIGGVVIEERVLVYGRAGYRGVIFRADGAGSRFTDIAGGPSIGGGLAVTMAEDVILRAEARHSLLQERRYRSGADTLTVDPAETSVSLGVAYRF
ncbi:MAG: porin family protein [Pseudomonadota bacterium]